MVEVLSTEWFKFNGYDCTVEKSLNDEVTYVTDEYDCSPNVKSKNFTPLMFLVANAKKLGNDLVDKYLDSNRG